MVYEVCESCLVPHPPCDQNYCYCAGKLGGWNRKGERFHPKCEAKFSQLFPGSF